MNDIFTTEACISIVQLTLKKLSLDVNFNQYENSQQSWPYYRCCHATLYIYTQKKPAKMALVLISYYQHHYISGVIMNIFKNLISFF